ncbi:hypothetical protein AncyloWKF20_07575 [Ancylobacter sp. WKF20]|uniref:hypothetical protein n=1 Tax=Ancylobacter sp. WKF20 TaxID=3039801 RepID=UPI002434519C|nr:hypothetical protein [Ancylobacter sp. WKF20]WGD31669.1 hypothetical protein AncyloWKF20_07575 [Ancylobacter sp. WKF20]
MRWRLLAAVGALAALLAGCKDYGRCLSSHDETVIVLMPMAVGNMTTYYPMPVTNTVCDQWEYPEGREQP